LKELVILLMGMGSKKQTAVEWLEEIIYGEKDFNLEEVISKAKEMEKQQIIDAHESGFKSFGFIHKEHGAIILKKPEQYYNETFKQ
jgi:hypothetical protein